jgi:hypothetical protein
MLIGILKTYNINVVEEVMDLIKNIYLGHGFYKK